MSTITTLHTVADGANIPLGYMDEDNIRFLQRKIAEVLSREFRQTVKIDRASIVRVMHRVLEERIETIPKMNQRVVMYLCAEFRNHQYTVDSRLRLEAHYVHSQKLYDPTVSIVRYDPQSVKTSNRLHKPHVGGTHRFYFT